MKTRLQGIVFSGKPSRGLGNFAGFAFPQAALFLLTLLAAWPVLRAGLPTHGDGLIHFYRLVELDWAVRHGVLFPRWMPDLGYGYGFPLFVYYPPLTYYAAEVFRLAGLSFAHSLLAVYALALALAATGAYRWGRDVLGEAGGFVVAAGYAFAPYLYLDVLARGALPEALALGLLPWVFWAYRRLAVKPGRAAFAAAALALTALILTHSISALAAAPLVGAYALICFWRESQGASLKTQDSRSNAKSQAPNPNYQYPTPNPQPLIPVQALALPVLLSAFFWLPALLEIEHVQASQLFIPALDFHNHFLTLDRLLAAPRPFDPRLVFFDFPASLGWPQALLALMGLAGAARAATRQSEERNWAVQTLFAGAALLLLGGLTLPASAGLWERLPLLRYVQFPWRLVGPASLMLALAAGAGAQAMARLLARRFSKRPVDWWLWVIGHGALASYWLFSLPWTFAAGYERLADPTVADIARYEEQTGQLGTTSAGEYLPVAVAELPRPDSLAARYAESPVIARLNRASLPAGAVVAGETAGLQQATATIDSPAAFTAVFDWFYYPGWQAEVDGQTVPIRAGGPHGLIEVDAPAGRHTLTIRFGATPLRRAAEAASVLTALVFGAWMVRGRKELRETKELREAKELREVARSVTSIPSSSRSSSSSLVSLCFLLTLHLIRAFYLDRFPNPFAHTRFDGATVAGITKPLSANFDGRLALIGLDLPRATIRSDESLEFDLYWRPLAAPLDADYSAAAHLVDENGFLFGQADSQHPGGLPTSRWREGQYAQDRHRLSLLPGAPPGTYRLVVGVYRFDTGASLGARDEHDVPQGTSVTVAEIVVNRPARPPTDAELAPSAPADEPLGPLTLAGYDLDAGPDGALAGSPVYVTLYWRANVEAPSDAEARPLLARLQIVAGNTILASQDAPPGGPGFPTTEWRAGEAIRAPLALRIPAEAPAGAAAIRLSLVGEAGELVAGPATLGEITIRAPERSTERPSFAYPAEADFGGVIRLLGYDLDPTGAGPGQVLRLTLYWESLAPAPQDYTVFAHLLDGQGRIVGQQDRQPLGGARPTTSWLPGEFLTDTYELSVQPDAPSETYTIEAGLYDAASGRRLPALGPDGQPLGDHVVLGEIAGTPP